jgi:hypothetical protein
MDSCNRADGFVVAVNTVKDGIADVTVVSQNMTDVQNVSTNMTDVQNVSTNMADVKAAVPAADAAAASEASSQNLYELVQLEADEVAVDMSYVAQTAAMLFAVQALGMGVIVDANGHLQVTLADMTNIEGLSIDSNGHLLATYTV